MMLEIDPDNLDQQLPELLEELLTGRGAIILKQAFDADVIAEARALIHHYTAEEDDKETHFLGASTDELTAGELIDADQRVVTGSLLGGREARGPEAYLGRYHQQVSVLPEDHQRKLFGWLSPGFNLHSVFPIYLANWLPRKRLHFSTTSNGSPRAMVPIGTYEEVMPMDILATQLLRALLVEDLEMSIALGCLELDEEDLALCTYACPGKYEYAPALRQVLTQIEVEG